MAAAGAATAHVRSLGELLALVDLERMAAAARGDRVRVVDLEPGFLEAVQVVDLRAPQVRGAERVDHDPDALEHELVVALRNAGVEPESVLEPRAAAALDRDAEDERVRVGFGRHQ